VAEIKFALKSKNLVDVGIQDDPPVDVAEYVYSGDIAELKGVNIELFEVDKDAGTRSKPKRAVSLAKFSANIEPDPAPHAGKPPGVLKLTKKPKVKLKPGTPRFKLKLAGEDFEIGLPGLDQEAGRRFEIQLVASASLSVPVPGKKKPDVTKLKFEAQQLLFARFGHFKNDLKAPVITFVTGAEDKGFFEAATTYWRQYADVVLVQEGMSLQEIAQFLANVAPQVMKETSNKGWGEVNIVCHGNKVSAIIKILKSSARRDLRITELDEALKAQATAFAVGPLGLTASSRVVFRACNIGHRPDLLARVKRDVFANQCDVFAPRFLQLYRAVRRDSTGQAVEGFVEEVTIHLPQSANPTDAQAEPALRAKFAKDQLARKITPAQSFDAEKASFKITKKSLENNPFTFPATTQTELQVTLVDRNTLRTVEQIVAKALDDKSGTDAFAFADSKHWQIGPFTGKRKRSSDMEFSGQSGGTPVRAFVQNKSFGRIDADGAELKAGGTNTIVPFLQLPGSGVPKGSFLQIAVKAPRFDVTDQSGSAVASGTVNGESVTTVPVGSDTLEARFSHRLSAGKVPFQRFSVSIRRDLKVPDASKDFKDRTLVVPDVTNKGHYGSSADQAPTAAELTALAD